MVTRTQTDVVVVGAGMAGLCAAIEAMEQGARVVTLEKGPRPGGSMRLSSGLIWTFESKSKLHDMIPDGNAALQDMVLDNLWEGLSWLEAHGVPFEEERAFMGYGRGKATNARDLSQALERHVQDLGGELALETPMESLMCEDGAVRGVRALTPGGSTIIEAGAVVLATGGFQGNPEMLARYVTPYVGQVYLRSNPWSTGDGFIAATEAGAAVTPGMAAFYGHSLAAPPTGFSASDFAEVTQRYGPVAIAINLDGRRFTDESAGTGEEWLNQAIAVQRDATAIYIVDGETSETPLRHGPVAKAAIERVRARGGPVLQEETLEDLCASLEDWGVASARALQTLREYNKALAEGKPDLLDPPRKLNRFPLMKPPFTAVSVRPGVTFTCGGIEVDTDMRVLRRSDSGSTLPLLIADHSQLRFNPIPNLFASGCDAGNISTTGYMGGLATALVTGRVAGKGAAACACRRGMAVRQK